MTKIIGAVVLRCGDSRNGSVEKALKDHFGWGKNTRVKTVSVAGGAHSREIDYDFLVHQVKIFSTVLLSKGAEEIHIIITDHEDCGYCQHVGSKDIGEFWSNDGFIEKIHAISPKIGSVNILTISYDNLVKPIVPSCELRIKEIAKHEKKAA